MYDVLDIARHIINYSNEQHYGVSNLKLQKLLYFVQAFYLSFTDAKEPCFLDRIEAWDFGPVVPTVYHEYKQYGSGNIPLITSYLALEDEDDIWSLRRVVFEDNIISEYDKEIIDSVVDKFSDYSASDLVELTHKQTPWRNAYEPYMNNEITRDSIRGYFSG